MQGFFPPHLLLHLGKQTQEATLQLSSTLQSFLLLDGFRGWLSCLDQLMQNKPSFHRLSQKNVPTVPSVPPEPLKEPFALSSSSHYFWRINKNPSQILGNLCYIQQSVTNSHQLSKLDDKIHATAKVTFPRCCSHKAQRGWVGNPDSSLRWGPAPVQCS